MRKSTLVLSILCIFLASAQTHEFLGKNDTLKNKFPSGKETYKALNQDLDNPFIVSFGTSMSQTECTSNTVHPDFISSQLQKIAQQQTDPQAWLGHSGRIWYVLKSLPAATCSDCKKTTDPEKINLETDATIIEYIIKNIAKNKSARFLTMTKCPHCKHAKTLSFATKEIPAFTQAHKQAMAYQYNYLNLQSQQGCKSLPAYRMSLEACDVLKDCSIEIDPTKLKAQADFLATFQGNIVAFAHHYSNPQAIPNLFEQTHHIAWFADYCAQLVQSCPQITHICPISQPTAFCLRVSRNNDLPPFSSKIDQEQFLQNMTQAQVQASIAMKKINPNIKVLVSHQWKPMKTVHTPTDPRYFIEKFVSKIAHNMYNGTFIRLIKPFEKYFDGIALSIYPPIRFNLWKPQGSNCADNIDAKSALEAIIATSKAFPGKDIYITETGCNTANPQTKKDFIDMTLMVCKLARDKGIPVKGVYFWGHTNDPLFYTEWNSAPGTTHFGPFDKLDPANPIASINASGLYIKEIIS